MIRIERTQKLVCLGDSHCLPLRDVVVRSELEDTPLLVSAHYINGFSALDMVDADGGVGAKVMAALRHLELCTHDGATAWKGVHPTAINASFAAGVPAAPPVLVIFCGDIDLRGAVFRQFNNSFDFDMPGDSAAACAGASKVAFSDVNRLLQAKLGPIITGIAALREAGFSRTYLSMIAPPSMEDEAAFEAAHGFPCPLPVRKKLTTLANDVLARLCAAAAIAFIDVRASVEREGLLAAPFRLDGFHMSTNGGLKIVEAVLDHAVHNSAAHFNKYLYGHAAAHAEPVTLEASTGFAEARETFNAEGVITCAVDIQPILAALGEREFVEDVGNRHLKLSWCGNGHRPFNPTMRSLTPDQALLRCVYELVYSEPALTYLQAALGADPHCISTRLFISHPHNDPPVGPQGYHHDGCPPGVIRALLYLVDVDGDNGPFEYMNEDQQSRLVTAPAGTLLIFDANRLLHRGSPPRERPRKVIDLCVAARPAGFPRRVIWAGMNNWPLDPYQFAVDAMIAYPPIEQAWIRVYPFSAAGQA